MHSIHSGVWPKESVAGGGHFRQGAKESLKNKPNSDFILDI